MTDPDVVVVWPPSVGPDDTKWPEERYFPPTIGLEPHQLNAILEQLIDRVDADPELRRKVLRESLRSSMLSNFWLR